MSDTDQVLESVADAEPNEPVVTEATPEEVVEAPEEVVTEEEPATEEVAEPEVTEEPEVVAEEAPAPVTTQEVVQNVQDILSSTETNVSVDNSESNDLENRVKVLEERLEKIISILSKQPNGSGGFIYQ
tara:strand:- start:1166 stop:1552 length:387 start_codon:yes stop_codon:yes gene_type:complete